MSCVKKLLAICLSTLFLAACGGSGGGLPSLPGGSLPGDYLPVDDQNDSMPDLEFVAISVPAAVDQADANYAVNFSIRNNGNVDVVPPFGVRINFYASRDDNITLDDKYLGSYTTTASYNGGKIAAGETLTIAHVLTLPEKIANGDYYFGGIIDPYYYGAAYLPPDFVNLMSIDESDKNNNFSEALAFSVTGSSTCTDDAYEIDNTSQQAALITLGETQERNFCFDNADWIRFDAVAGNAYVISREYVSSAWYPKLTIHNTDGATVMEKAPSYDTDLLWAAPVSGTYYIKVHASNYQAYYASEGDGVGTEYTVSLN